MGTAMVERNASVAMQVFGDDYAAIKSGIAPNLSDTELDYLASVARSMGLSVLRKQVYGIKRRQKQGDQWVDALTIQVGIDGYRVIADRTGKYAGQVGPLWCGPDGQWRDVWLDREPPAAAKVGVLRRDFREPLWAVAVYESYVARNKDGSPSSMWAKMPEILLAKCAESLALRKAFPDEMAGTYTDDEMEQADNTPATTEPRAITEAPEPISARASTLPTNRSQPDERALLMRKLWVRAKSLYGAAEAEEKLHGWLAMEYPDAVLDGKPSIRALTDEQVAAMVAVIEESIVMRDTPEPNDPDDETATE